MILSTDLRIPNPYRLVELKIPELTASSVLECTSIRMTRMSSLGSKPAPHQIQLLDCGIVLYSWFCIFEALSQMRTETSRVQLEKLFSWEVTIALQLRLCD